MPDSLHEIQIAADPETVFRAFTTAEGLASWWTRDSRKAEDGYTFGFDGGSVRFYFRADDEVAGERVRWTGVAGDKMPDEWVGTRIAVDLEPTDGGTRVRFGHEGWASADGAYRMCNTTWGELVFRLRDHCEGKGRGPLFGG